MTPSALLHWVIGLSPMTALLGRITVVLGLAWLCHLALRNGNQRRRATLWRCTAGAIVALPILSVFAPVVRVPVAPVWQAAAIEATPAELTPAARLAMPPSVSAGQRPRAGLRISASACATLLAGGWLIGVAVMLVRLGIGARGVRRLLASSGPAPAPVALQCARMARRLGCRRRVAVRTTEAGGGPVLVGALRPVVVVPSWLCDPARSLDLAAVFAHELSHVRSADQLWGRALQLVAAGLWFHPLAWRMGAAHAMVCELVSDAASAAALGGPGFYARTLVSVAVDSRQRAAVAFGLPMARASQLRARLHALRRSMLGGRLAMGRLVVCWVAALAALLVVAGPRLAAGGQGEPTREDAADVAPAVASGPSHVVLKAPYPQTNGNALTDTIAVEDAVRKVLGYVGVPCDWDASRAASGELLRAEITPAIDGAPWEDALRTVLEPVGLTYTVYRGTITLEPSVEDGAWLGPAASSVGAGHVRSPILEPHLRAPLRAVMQAADLECRKVGSETIIAAK